MSQSMNDGPPADWDNMPPSDGYGHPAERSSNTQRRAGSGSKEPNFDVKSELLSFYEMLDDGKFQKELHDMLPDTITVQGFIRTAKTAIQNNPNLLNPDWRPSLLRCIVKAANQGLLPDGKHGAFIPRKDNQAGGKYQVCWQPMIWGITQLGRRAGALKKISAHIVFEGEEYELLGGEDDVIKHRINPKIVDEVYRPGVTSTQFFDKIILAYCIITAPDGTVTWRWMPKSRILAVRDTSKAGNGPWTGVFRDEMVIKTVMLFTSKWIDLDGDTPEMRRFKEALETDMEADFDLIDGRTPAASIEAQPSRPALSAPSPKLDKLTDTLASNDKVEVTNSQPLQQQPRPDQQQQDQQKKQEKMEKARSRATEFVGQVLAALRQTEASDEVDEIVKTKLDGIKRLSENWKDGPYQDLIAGMVATPGLTDRIGGLQIVLSTFYDDVIKQAIKPANTDEEAGKAA